MNGRSVPNHQQSCARATNKMLKEGHTMNAIQRLRTHQCVHLSLKRDAAHDRQVIASLPFVDHGPLTFRSISPDQPWQQIEAGFIDKNQGSAFTLGPAPQFGPDISLPSFDRLLVPLHGAGDGHLWGPTQLFQQPGDVVLMVTNTEFQFQDLDNACTRPDLTANTIGFRTVPQEIRYQALLLGRQLRMTSVPVRPQLGRPAFREVGQPLADRRFRDSQSVRNVSVHPAQPCQVHRSKTTPFTPILDVARLHPPIVSSENLSGLRSWV